VWLARRPVLNSSSMSAVAVIVRMPVPISGHQAAGPTRRSRRGPCVGVPPGHGDRPAWTCAPGSRASSPGGGCSVGTSSSRSSLRPGVSVPRGVEPARGWPGGAEPGKCKRRRSEVSTRHRPRTCGQTFGVTRRGLPAIPLAGRKKVAKLWTVWKTQDSRRSRLWITSRAGLLALGGSVRIGATRRGSESLSPHLENDLSSTRYRTLPRSAPVARMGFPQTVRRAGGVVVPFPQRTIAKGAAESTDGCATPFT
jgi:hypothetical protein